MIQTFKILHGYCDDNCVSSLFTFKDTITRGHKLSGHGNAKLTSDEIYLQHK